MHCKNCGSEISDGVKICPECGTPVTAAKLKKSPVKAIIAIFLVLAVLAGGTAIYFSSRSNRKNSCKGEKNTTEISFSDKNAGDIIEFGFYEQDNKTSNGKEKIEWIVLAKEKDRMLVISKFALDCCPYNPDNTIATWENCTLRKWMNETFYNEAFTSEEQNMIQTTNIVNSDNSKVGTSGGNDTIDKIFLLSCEEAKKYFSSDEARICSATAYASAQGDFYFKRANGEVLCTWWIRSPVDDSNNARHVDDYGGLGYYVSSYRDGVRPALYINL